jgi:hypothetical protein
MRHIKSDLLKLAFAICKGRFAADHRLKPWCSLHNHPFDVIGCTASYCIRIDPMRYDVVKNIVQKGRFMDDNDFDNLVKNCQRIQDEIINGKCQGRILDKKPENAIE